MKGKTSVVFAIIFLIITAAIFPIKTSAQTVASAGLPDFAVTGMSVRAKTGVGAGSYLYITIANLGDSVTSQNYLSATISGLEPIGLPDGFVLYLTGEKTDAGYVYAKGYAKEFIGPRVDGAGVKQLTPVVTLDLGNYFTETDRSNDIFTRTIPTSAATAAAVNDGNAVYESGKNLSAILSNAKKTKNAKAQTAAMKTYTEPIAKDTKISTAEKYAINNFIVYGTATTKTKTQALRAAAVRTYIANFNRIPVAALDWQDVITLLTVK
jgi:hypothetical protein